MAERPELFQRLMAVNEAFCVAWANAQIRAGATAICYFDPVGSSTVVTPDQYRNLNLALATRTLAQIQGPTATHFASGRALPVLDQVAATGTLAIGTSSLEDLGEVKRAAQGKLAVLGNWNSIEMCRWNPDQAEREVKRAIASAGKGGGLILAESHGEIPWQVPESVLDAVSEAVHRWGTYPLQGLDPQETP
jgi:uroporphyrinogen decarboxylase